MKIKSTVFFRTDGNKAIGLGHIKRCIILGKELKQRKIESAFILKNSSSQLENHLNEEGFLVHKLNNESTELKQLLSFLNPNDFIIFDSDNAEFYSESFQKKLLEQKIKFMHITFYNNCKFYSHIVHNQNPISQNQRYISAQHTKKLFGLKYVILHPDYSEFASSLLDKDIEPNKKLLISFGGSDSQNRTQIILNNLLDLNLDIEKIYIIIGALYPYEKSLKEQVKIQNRYDINVLKNVSNMAELMYNCDWAFTSGGLTSWELGALKINNAIFSFSEREKITAEYLSEKGLTTYLGHVEKTSNEILKHNINRYIFNNKSIPITKKLHSQINVNGRLLVVDEIINIIKNG